VIVERREREEVFRIEGFWKCIFGGVFFCYYFSFFFVFSSHKIDVMDALEQIITDDHLPATSPFTTHHS
jgi:hypothetical protein